eukprot:3448076-Amphidinium_carterae.1
MSLCGEELNIYGQDALQRHQSISRCTVNVARRARLRWQAKPLMVGSALGVLVCALFARFEHFKS